MGTYTEQLLGTAGMSSEDKLVHELNIATDAGIGVIAIRCPATEVYNIVNTVYALAMDMHTEFRLHTALTGWAEYPKIDPDDDHANPFDVLKPDNVDTTTAPVNKAFDKLANDELPEDGMYVMLDLYYSFGDMQTQTSIRRQAQKALDSGQRLFLIVPQGAEIPEDITPLIHIINFDYPTRDELSEVLDVTMQNLEPESRPGSATETIKDKDGKKKEVRCFSEEERNAIVSNGQGMALNNFETAIALSITSYTQNSDEGFEGFTADHIISMIRDYKTQLLRKTNVLELQPNVPIDEIGGLDLFKGWMQERAMTFTDKAKQFNVTPSRGALVVGPPGTGKSMVAKAAGSILNMPVIRFDVGRVFGAYVGQSEQAMRTVLGMIDAMAPCVLMLDEIDKGFSGMSGGGSGDSGTTQRVFGTFLTWMQERDQKDRPVFLIMTANRVQGLPPELLRKGRVDEIWSVNMPNDDERKQIIDIHARKRGIELEKSDIAGIARLSKNLVGSEIEAMIEDALVMSLSNDEPGVTYEGAEAAKQHLKPMAETRKEDFDAMRQWAEQNARPASSPMLPSAGTATGRPAKTPTGSRRKITPKRAKRT